MSDRVIRIIIDPSRAVSGAADVGTAVDGIGRKVKETTSLIDRMAQAMIADRVLRELRELSDGFTEVQNRIRTVTATEAEMVAVTDQLFKVAQDTRTSWESTAATFQRVSQATHELGLSTDQVVAFTKELNQAFIIAGVSAGEQTRVTRDLLHGLDQGTLAWRQLLPIMSQAPSVARIIAEHFHVTTGELHHLATAGKITGAELIAAFHEAGAKLDSDFGKTVPTITQGMIELKNAATKFLGEMLQGNVIMGALGAGLQLLIDHFDVFGRVLVAVGIALLIDYAATAIPAAIAATQAFTAELLLNPLFLGVAIVAGIYLFRDAIADAFSAVLEFAEGLPVVGQALRLLEAVLGVVGKALGLIADAAGVVADAFGALYGATIGPLVDGLGYLAGGIGDAISLFGDMLDVVGDVIAGLGEGLGGVLSDLGGWLRGSVADGIEAFTVAMGGARRATIGEIMALVELGQALRESGRMAQAFVAVDIVKRTTDLVAMLSLVASINREIAATQVTAAKVFGQDLTTAVEKATGIAEDAKRASEAYAAATAALRHEIDQLRASLSPTVTANQQLAEVIDKVTEAERRHILTAAEGTRLIQARTIAIAEQQIAADQSIDRQSASVADLLAADERRLALQRAITAAAPGNGGRTPDAPGSGQPDRALTTIEDIQRAMDALAKTTDQTVVNAIHNVATAFAELATTGKFNWRSLTESILSDLTKMIARMIEMKLLSLALGLIGGGSGGAATGAVDYFASQAAGTPVYGGAHADGGSFTAPGTGGADSVPVLFHMTPGETATFDGNRASSPAAAAPAPVNIMNQVVIDPAFVPSMMASPAGYRAQMEFVRLHASQISAILGR